MDLIPKGKTATFAPARPVEHQRIAAETRTAYSTPKAQPREAARGFFPTAKPSGGGGGVTKFGGGFLNLFNLFRR